MSDTFYTRNFGREEQNIRGGDYVPNCTGLGKVEGRQTRNKIPDTDEGDAFVEITIITQRSLGHSLLLHLPGSLSIYIYISPDNEE